MVGHLYALWGHEAADMSERMDTVKDTLDGVLIDVDEDGFHLILSGEKAEYNFRLTGEIALELMRATDREIKPWWLEGGGRAR